MPLADRIRTDMKQALKSGDRAQLGVLRMLRAKIQEAEVALRSKAGSEARLDDERVQEVVAAYAKQRRESIESYRSAGRDDLAAREEAELAVIREYLPAQLGEAEIRAVVEEAIAAAGASSPRDLGAVMKHVMPRVKGRADGREVNRVVRELLDAAGSGATDAS